MWGNNNYGQLSNENEINQNIPKEFNYKSLISSKSFSNNNNNFSIQIFTGYNSSYLFFKENEIKTLFKINQIEKINYSKSIKSSFTIINYQSLFNNRNILFFDLEFNF